MQNSQNDPRDEMLTREFAFAIETIPDRGFSAAVSKRIRRLRYIRLASLASVWLITPMIALWLSPSNGWLNKAWLSMQQQLHQEPSLLIMLLVLATISLPCFLLSEDA